MSAPTLDYSRHDTLGLRVELIRQIDNEGEEAARRLRAADTAVKTAVGAIFDNAGELDELRRNKIAELRDAPERCREAAASLIKTLAELQEAEELLDMCFDRSRFINNRPRRLRGHNGHPSPTDLVDQACNEHLGLPADSLSEMAPALLGETRGAKRGRTACTRFELSTDAVSPRTAEGLRTRTNGVWPDRLPTDDRESP